MLLSYHVQNVLPMFVTAPHTWIPANAGMMVGWRWSGHFHTNDGRMLSISRICENYVDTVLEFFFNVLKHIRCFDPGFVRT